MRNFGLITLLALLICGIDALTTRTTISRALSLTPTPVPTPNAPLDGSWQLVFNDEFDGQELDTTKWMTRFPWGRNGANSSELQYYVEDAFEVINGIHRIKAEQRSVAGFDYTSGIITSFGVFTMTYGYVEARVRVPSGQGFWPAFWLLPEDQSWPPEIDVFEILGHETDTVYMTNHWQTDLAEHMSVQETHQGPDFAADFHTFACQWQPGEIVWYIDGVERFRTNQGVPTKPMYLLVNLAVGGEWPGNPDETTPFPGYLEIDYIRAYQPFDDHYDHQAWLPIIFSGETSS